VPTYQYACTACGERLEAVQSFTDAPLTECPACAGALRKVFSAVGVVFKGSGFYKTDSRKGSGSEKKSDSAGGEAAAKTDSAPKAETKTDSAPKATPSTSTTPAAKSA
jgi:putative FmdB family regulatory protein